MSEEASKEIVALKTMAEAMLSVPGEAHKRMMVWMWDRFIDHPPPPPIQWDRVPPNLVQRLRKAYDGWSVSHSPYATPEETDLYAAIGQVLDVLEAK